MKQFFFTIILIFGANSLFSQNVVDTIIERDISPITILASRYINDIQRLTSVQGTYIFDGKKSEVINISKKNLAFAEKYGRQIFAKIPGVFVYDMDGTGNQVNISTRGLDPHRSWELNIRKDGISTNSDMYGYPASHYNIPMEAVEKIELVRGIGSLQYGAQFGGMINYVSKEPDSTKKFAVESINSVGSYGLISTYLGASGKLGKFRYFTWANSKKISGYRKSSASTYDAEGVSLYYDGIKNAVLKLDWTHSNYITQLPGPLTDSMFHLNPQMATRTRNYYQPNIHIPSISFDMKLGSSIKVQLTSSAVIGARNSVQFDKPATVADSIVHSTYQYNPRQVDIDHFNSYTSELRLLKSYKSFGNTSFFSSGLQYMNNDLHRQQQGLGTTGDDFDLSLMKPGWGRDLHFKTNNLAIFFENHLTITPKLSFNAGGRMELGKTRLSGTTVYYPDGQLNNEITHKFPLFGLSSQYNISDNIHFYGGLSQAYRPVILKDIVPQSIYEITDKNLKDAKGYVIEIGNRGSWKNIRWDVSLFDVQYDHRIGTLAMTDSIGNLLIYRTNIGNSRTKGVECFIQSDISLSQKASISIFTSTSYMDARYDKAKIKSGSTNEDVSGNYVESVPNWISRNGCTYAYLGFRASLLYSYTGSSFADALNSIQPNASGSTGLVPAYQIVDFNFNIKLSSHIQLRCNVNNIFNEHYFVKRPQFYPGPGIWPSDGRTYSATVTIKI
ncbi:MAG: TonB-dependent receptor [Saprospiraceae bacterium]|nr:TonB-dependent receptor [Saprospiraceae bacterium]